MECTVIGDDVNLASRVEGRTPQLGESVMMSESSNRMSGTNASPSRSARARSRDASSRSPCTGWSP
ncbi:MAG: hypothetical protein HYY25_15735 [Candidatus Wallbacteria bacterium]|nr:hypothetical protein [Candidatus Wallbacteria bacterium]